MNEARFKFKHALKCAICSQEASIVDVEEKRYEQTSERSYLVSLECSTCEDSIAQTIDLGEHALIK